MNAEQAYEKFNGSENIRALFQLHILRNITSHH